MKIKSAFTQNFYMDPEEVRNAGNRISTVMTGVNGCIEGARGLIGQIASLAAEVPAEAKCGALISACDHASMEMAKSDFAEYGILVNNSMMGLADHSEAVMNETIGKMGGLMARYGGVRNTAAGLRNLISFKAYKNNKNMSFEELRNIYKQHEKGSEDEEYSTVRLAATLSGVSLDANGRPIINGATDAQNYSAIMQLSLYGKPGDEVTINRNGNTYILRLSSMTFDDAVDAQCSLTDGAEAKKLDGNNRSSYASREDIYKNMNPCNFMSGDDIYQFIDLSYNENRVISIDEARERLAGQGILDGQEETFLNAGKNNNVDPRYLIGHARLETGNGTSELAIGYEYNGRTVYNMYGYGATDGNAVKGGAETAYNNEWFSIEAAIEGGAKKIAGGYIGKDQNTLYDMRWNSPSPATHQYATDVEWAIKQTSSQHMAEIYADAEGEGLQFCIPVYMSERNENR